MSLKPFILLYSKQPTLLHVSNIYCCHHFLAGWLIIVFVLILELGVVLLVASCCRAIAFAQRLLARWVPQEPPWRLFCWKRQRATMRSCSQATTWEPICIWQKMTVTVYRVLCCMFLFSFLALTMDKTKHLIFSWQNTIVVYSALRN